MVPAEEMIITVQGKVRASISVDTEKNKIIKLSPGKTAQVPLVLPDGSASANIDLIVELDDPPPGLLAGETTIDEYRENGYVEIIAETNAKPGIQGNLILKAFTVKQGVKKKSLLPNQKPVFLCTLPAVPFEIMP